MSLKFIKGKKINSSDIPTCQTHCELFDHESGRCGFFDEEVPNDPLHTAECDMFLSTEEWTSFSDDILSAEDENEQTINVSNRGDAVWYTSPDGTFSCWIISLSRKNRLMKVTNELERGWHPEVYRFPYPLHNHNCGSENSTSIAWIIDENGFGQYAWIDDGEISYFHPQK